MKRAVRIGTAVGLLLLGWRGLAKEAEPAPAPADTAAQEEPAERAAPAEPPPGPMALPEIPQEGAVTFVPIEGMIDLGVAPFLERLTKEAKAGDLLILEVNTLGGRIDAAIVMRDALLDTKATTVCWIHPRAISAGALICLAADVIVVAPGATIGAATPVQVGGGGEMQPVEEKVVSYMRKEMGSTATAKGRRGDIAESMVDADLAIPGLIDEGKLLTMDGQQALDWGLASFTAGTEAELFAGLSREPPAEIRRPTPSWAEKVARFLSDPVVSGLLMTLGMLGILVELYSGGNGVGLTVGIVCLGLFFFGHHVVNLAGWEEIVLFVVGAALLGFEIFVPGHIVPGVIGALCILAALVMALVNLDSVPFDVAWAQGFVRNALFVVFAAIVSTTFLGWGLTKALGRSALGRSLVLSTALTGKADDPVSAGNEALVGVIGRAATDLRPSGKIEVDGRRIEAVAERGYVEKGSRVKILKAERSHVRVRALPPEDSEEGAA